jgi:hypothetical protein
MGLWSEQRNDYRSPLVELANTTQSVEGITKREIIVRARAASPSILVNRLLILLAVLIFDSKHSQSTVLSRPV